MQLVESFKKREYLKFILPGTAFIVVLLIVPTFFLFYVSLYKYNVMTPQDRPFVGLENFLQVVRDQYFWDALGVSLTFSVCALSIEIVFALGIALILNSKLGRFSSATSILIATPVMMSSVGIAILWRIMYHPTIGILNFLLSSLRLPTSAWIDDPSTALPSVILVDVWHWTPFIALILFAGLRMIQGEYYDAAAVDGASMWQIFRHVTLPLLKNMLLIALLFRLADAIKLFDEVAVLTWGGPNRVTETVSMYIFRTAFIWFDVGKAAVQSLIFLFVAEMITIPIIRLLRKK